MCSQLKVGWSLLCTVPAPILVVCPLSCYCRVLGSGQHNPPPGINTLVWMAPWGDKGHRGRDDAQTPVVGEGVILRKQSVAMSLDKPQQGLLVDKGKAVGF